MKSRRAPFTGLRGSIKPSRSQVAVQHAANDKLAVELGLSSFLAGQDPARRRARLQEAARQVTRELGKLSGAACSAVSKGPSASIVVFGGRGGDDA